MAMSFKPMGFQYAPPSVAAHVVAAPSVAAAPKKVEPPLMPRGLGWPIAEPRPPKAWRKWVGRGQSSEVVILDKKMGPKLREHNWKHPVTGRFDMYDACVSGEGHCTLCEGMAHFGKPRASMILSCYDYSRYSSKDPRILLAFSSMKWLNMFEAHFAEHGTLEGLHIRMDRAVDETSSIGSPTILGIKKLSDLRKAEPYDYAEMFPPQTPASIRRRYLGEAPVGSMEDIIRELSEQPDEQD